MAKRQSTIHGLWSRQESSPKRKAAEEDDDTASDSDSETGLVKIVDQPNSTAESLPSPVLLEDLTSAFLFSVCSYQQSVSDLSKNASQPPTQPKFISYTPKTFGKRRGHLT